MCSIWIVSRVLCTEPGSIVSTSFFYWSSNDSTPSANSNTHTHTLLQFWISPGTWPQPCPRNSSPCGWAFSWLSASTTSAIQLPSWKHNCCHFWQWSPYVLILELPFSHFDTHFVTWCCPCKTGTSTHSPSTTMGGKDRGMTAISKVYPACWCLIP